MTTTNETSPTVGIYSAAAAEIHGTAIFIDKSGNEVEVTYVCRSPEYIKKYNWDDAVVVSTSLYKWLRDGKPSNRSTFPLKKRL